MQAGHKAAMRIEIPKCHGPNSPRLLRRLMDVADADPLSHVEKTIVRHSAEHCKTLLASLGDPELKDDLSDLEMTDESDGDGSN